MPKTPQVFSQYLLHAQLLIVKISGYYSIKNNDLIVSLLWCILSHISISTQDQVQ